MSNYVLYTDAAADIPAHYYDEYEIRTIPMDYLLNGKSITFYTESKERNRLCEELYKAQKEDADVHTSQITIYHYTEAWEKELEEGRDILYICFSSGLSSTYNNALVAASQLEEKYPEKKIVVVDSLAGTTGQGIIVVLAAKDMAAGASIEETKAHMEEIIPYMCHRFMVGDLGYLRKGGRVSAAAAAVGTLLSIKPLLIIDDAGKLEVVAKVRGEKAALRSIVRSCKAQLGAPGTPKMFFISHSCHYEEAEELKKQILEECGEDTIVECVPQSPVIGVHTGPRFFAVCGFGLHRKEN